jgi:hypothetical protein
MGCNFACRIVQAFAWAGIVRSVLLCIPTHTTTAVDRFQVAQVNSGARAGARGVGTHRQGADRKKLVFFLQGA